MREYRDALLTVIAAGLAFAAFDDITTDNDINFAIERAMLLVCAGWAAWVGWSERARGRPLSAGVSLLVLAAAVWGQANLSASSDTIRTMASLSVVMALVWFLIVAGMIVRQVRAT